MLPLRGKSDRHVIAIGNGRGATLGGYRYVVPTGQE
jgi:hypothetical protein